MGGVLVLFLTLALETTYDRGLWRQDSNGRGWSSCFLTEAASAQGLGGLAARIPKSSSFHQP